MIKNFFSDYTIDNEKLNGFYIGVCEDNIDPDKRGRIRVRIFGLHSSSTIKKNNIDGIPVDELPWCNPMYGISEGSISGNGSWNVPLQGSHVIVFFINGNIQNPCYLGTLGGIYTDSTLNKEITESYIYYGKKLKKAAQETAYEVGNVDKIEFKSSNTLGEISKRWESGTKGSYAISSGKGDYGGVSYGSYQFASNTGSVEPFVATLPQEQQNNFSGLTPGTSSYSEAWTQSVDELGEEQFFEYEHSYIKDNYYDPAATKINSSTGINADEHCAGVQDLIWSSSVQHGPTGAKNLFVNAGVDDSMTSTEIINAVYKERSRTEKYFGKSSKNVQNSVRKRFVAEQKMALAKCGEELPEENEIPDELADATEEELEEDIKLDEDTYTKRYISEYSSSSTSNEGFKDPNNEYPTMNYYNEPDVHKLARGITADTIVETKNSNIETGKSIALGGTWDEPESFYNAEYPHNWVISTHGGTTIEIDSTPGKERFHLYHPSNTYLEINESGDMIIRNDNNKYCITEGNKKEYIKEDCDELVDGNKTSKIEGTEIKEITSNQTITIHGNQTINVTGDCKVTASTINLN